MKKIFFYSCLLLIIFDLFNSCASTSHVANRITVESGQIPPDMQTENFIIIGVLTGRNSYDKYMRKEFDEYTGEYELAKVDKIKTTYQDVNKYRYLLDYNQHNNQYYAPASPGSNSRGYSNTTSYQYYILDRKENKKYFRKGESSFFALEMKAYLKAIDDVRKK